MHACMFRSTVGYIVPLFLLDDVLLSVGLELQ
jgi:hypothetical protein